LYPTNDARIVFAVSTNIIDRGYPEALHWKIPYEKMTNQRRIKDILPDGTIVYYPPPSALPQPEIPIYRFYSETYAWWNVTPKNEPLTDWLSNAVFQVRTERNWTNYYEFCRSGLTNNINRIRQDAEMDLHCLILSSDDDQLQFMMNDPLLPQFIKDRDVQVVIDGLWWGWEVDENLFE